MTVVVLDPATLASCLAKCGRGRLVAIDPKTGARIIRANDVLLFGPHRDLADSIRADGSTAAFVTGNGHAAVVSPPGGEPTRGVRGGSPTLSRDGRTVGMHVSAEGSPSGAGQCARSADTLVWLASEPLQSVRPQPSRDRSPGRRPQERRGLWRARGGCVDRPHGGRRPRRSARAGLSRGARLQPLQRRGPTFPRR